MYKVVLNVFVLFPFRQINYLFLIFIILISKINSKVLNPIPTFV